MSAATEAAKSRASRRPSQRIFGIPLGVDPKILVFALVAVAAALFWYNSRSDDEGPASSTATRSQPQPVADPAAVVPGPVSAIPSRPRAVTQRRRGRVMSDSGTLKLRAIDATRGDVDPMLRLDLLERLRAVKPAGASRNIFESGAAAQAEGGPIPVRTIMPGPKPILTPGPPQYPAIVQPTANIPFKYYGFAKPYNAGEPNRGFFLQGDDVVMAAEGQLVQGRYRVLQLTASTAKVEDTQVQLSQTLPVLPESVEQQQ